MRELQIHLLHALGRLARRFWAVAGIGDVRGDELELEQQVLTVSGAA